MRSSKKIKMYFKLVRDEAHLKNLTKINLLNLIWICSKFLMQIGMKL